MAEKNYETYTPYVDIVNKEKGVDILLDVPGIAKPDVQIAVKNNSLTVEATAYIQEEGKEKHVFRKYKKNFFVSSEVFDTKKSEVHLENGVLNIKIPKSSQQEGHYLTIQ